MKCFATVDQKWKPGQLSKNRRNVRGRSAETDSFPAFPRNLSWRSVETRRSIGSSKTFSQKIARLDSTFSSLLFSFLFVILWKTNTNRIEINASWRKRKKRKERTKELLDFDTERIALNSSWKDDDCSLDIRFDTIAQDRFADLDRFLPLL